jgi:uroporphyrinogen-III synthase
MSFAGLRVLALESRRAAETAKLIQNKQGDAFVAPSMREVPIEQNTAAFQFAGRLYAGEFDMIVFLTGVGARYLHQVLGTRYEPAAFIRALRQRTIVCRGPKPLAVCREWDVPVAAVAPEPNTWHEVLAVTESRTERDIAVQEYGRPNYELIRALEARGARVTSVPVYQWQMPDDLEPLREACRRLAAREVDVAMFTTTIQIDHLLRIAGELKLADAVRDGLRHSVIASVGPTTSEALREFGFEPDMEPSHPKLGFLVQETAVNAAEILRRKR